MRQLSAPPKSVMLTRRRLGQGVEGEEGEEHPRRVKWKFVQRIDFVRGLGLRGPVG